MYFTENAGVDDLLENTRHALGLHLERSEAEALVSILDVNRNSTIQCEELEVGLQTAGTHHSNGRGWQKDD